MKNRIVLPILATASALLALAAAQEASKLHHLEVERTDDLGRIYYVPVALKNAQFQFVERQNSLDCYSKMMDCDLDVGPDGHLSTFALTLRGETNQQWASIRGGQTYYPQFAQTIYVDLDGDTIFDVMSNTNGRFILLSNSWLQVESSMLGVKSNTIVRSSDGKTNYTFQGHSWQIQHD